MMIAYLDTSAAMKLIVGESESPALADALNAEPARMYVASWLLHAELHCAAARRVNDISATVINRVLSKVLLVDVARGDLISAGTHAPLRAQDAIHLAVALRLGVDQLIAYDTELLAAADRAGLPTLSPA